MKETHPNFIDMYLDWIRTQSTQVRINEYSSITTPFMDTHNDFLQFYIKQQDDSFYLTDDGYILDDLETSGCDIESPKRKETIIALARSMGVSIRGKEIVAEASIDNIAQKQHSLLQAMLKINDMLLTTSTRVRGLFFEEIEEFFGANDIRYSPSVLLMGASGLSHRFDFIIPASKKHPERLLSAMNSPTKDKVQSALFAWDDTKSMRINNSEAYIIFNDTKKNVGIDLINAVTKCQITPFPWKERNKFIEKLAG